MKRAGLYAFGAIALYLLVYNGSKSGTVITAGANGIANDVKAFKGRG